MKHELNPGRRMHGAIHWEPPNRHNVRMKRYIVLRPWRGVLAGETVALPDADAWRLLAAGAVLEVARDGQADEVETIQHPITGAVIPVVWVDSVDPVSGEPMRVGIVQTGAE